MPNYTKHSRYNYINTVLSLDFTAGKLIPNSDINYCESITVNPERIASVIFNDFINPATLTSLYDKDFSRVLHAHAHNVAH